MKNIAEAGFRNGTIVKSDKWWKKQFSKIYHHLLKKDVSSDVIYSADPGSQKLFSSDMELEDDETEKFLMFHSGIDIF